MKPLIPTLSLMVTYQCNIACRHCGPYCGPRERDWMSADEMRDLIAQAGELGAGNVVFTGGEPTLLGDDLPRLLRFIRDETPIASSRLVTNGKWAVTYDAARRLAERWREAGLEEMNISCGEYHQEFVPLSSVANAYRACRDAGYPTVLLAGEFLAPGRGRLEPEDLKAAVGEDLIPPALMSPYVGRVHGMSCGAAMPYGRGAGQVPPGATRRQALEKIQGPCGDILAAITAHPNGKTTACCGIMVRDESLLNIGNWRRERLRPLLEAAHQDLILNWIRYLGLHDMRRWLLAKAPDLAFRDTYSSICDLCAEMIYDPRCRDLLVAHAGERRDDVVAAKVALDATLYEPGRFLYADQENGRAPIPLPSAPATAGPAPEERR